MLGAIEGVWEGTLEVGSGRLRVVLKIKRAGTGWTATADSPDQNAYDIPVDRVAVDGEKLEIDVLRINLHYAARMDADRLTGTMTQNGQTRALDLRRNGTPPTTAPRPAAAREPALDGNWAGALQIGAVRLRLVVKIRRVATGWEATVDSLDQNARDIPVGAVTFDGGRLKLDLPGINARYEGRVDRDTLAGSWTQGGQVWPLDLTRTETPPVPRPRVQEPKRPLPYDEIETVVENPTARITLACTLTKPHGDGPFAGVVLLTGSGPQDRDEALMGHKPFLVLSDAITRAGVEVLRCDDRGVGKSTGAFANATTFDFAEDALAEVAALRGRPEIARAHVGVLGHSEGSTVAAIAAARSTDLAFIVLLAGPALPGDQILDLQRAWLEKTAGVSGQKIAESKAQWHKVYAILKSEKDVGAAREKLRAIYAGLPGADRQELDRKGGFDAQVEQVLSPWFRTFITLDPRTFLAKVKVPVLAIDGERDRQVPPDANLPEMRKALVHDRDVTVRELPGLNHLFQTAETGALAEYGKIDETMSPAALKLVSDWIAQHAS
ncbi:MAG TPA: alpha/beta hydrolase [Polyangia bacterium]|nr:alpha/beta hydrolase [Polyangia bacterium]